MLLYFVRKMGNTESFLFRVISSSIIFLFLTSEKYPCMYVMHGAKI